jgi:signal transduction histidine kinase
MAQMIFKEAWDLDFQLRTIFAAAEIEAGEGRLHISEVNILQSMRRLIESFEIRSEVKEIAVSLEINPKTEDLIFATDSEKLQIIVSNLLSNAIEFAYPSTGVCISIAHQPKELKIAVHNRGPKIDEKDLERIFDRFVQLDTGTTKLYKGHGLGLAVVKGATELLDGHLHVQSEADGETVFSIILPNLSSGQDELSFSDASNEVIF